MVVKIVEQVAVLLAEVLAVGEFTKIVVNILLGNATLFINGVGELTLTVVVIKLGKATEFLLVLAVAELTTTLVVINGTSTSALSTTFSPAWRLVSISTRVLAPSSRRGPL